MTRRIANIPAHEHNIEAAPELPKRSEAWFIAAGGGRDAFRRGDPITAAPFTSHDVSWQAWRLGWVGASRGEDVTARYALRPAKRKATRIDYTAEALQDFLAYAVDPRIEPELRAEAFEIRQIISRNANLGINRRGEG